MEMLYFNYECHILCHVWEMMPPQRMLTLLDMFWKFFLTQIHSVTSGPRLEIMSKRKKVDTPGHLLEMIPKGIAS